MNIEYISNNGICCGCGFCESICPVNAISLKENVGGFLCAAVDNSTCIKCNKCLSICPSYNRNKTIAEINDSVKGNCVSGYIGCACEKTVRREGQSGGVVSALILYLLDNSLIDGAVLNRFNGERLRPEAFYANNKDEVLEACGSYYTQSAVGNVVKQHSDKKIAAVLLGCQAEAITIDSGKNIKRPEYIFGLICAGQNSGRMIDSIIDYASIEKEAEHIRKFRFRYSHPARGGWPGDIYIITDKGRYQIKKEYRHFLKPYNESFRCRLCYDQMCTDADIIFGDPWGFNKDHGDGESVFIARTLKGKELIEAAIEASYIKCERVKVDEIFEGETVYKRHIPQFKKNVAICEHEKWVVPYSVSDPTKKDIKINKSDKKRLLFCRNRMLAKTESEFEQIIKKYNRDRKRLDKLSTVKAAVSIPYSVIKRIKTIIIP